MLQDAAGIELGVKNLLVASSWGVGQQPGAGTRSSAIGGCRFPLRKCCELLHKERCLTHAHADVP